MKVTVQKLLCLGKLAGLGRLAGLYPLLPVQNLFLIWQLSKRDVLGRYKGSVLGVGWSLIYPLLLLATYTVVFRTIFKARWPGAEDSPEGPLVPSMRHGDGRFTFIHSADFLSS